MEQAVKGEQCSAVDCGTGAAARTVLAAGRNTGPADNGAYGTPHVELASKQAKTLAGDAMRADAISAACTVLAVDVGNTQTNLGFFCGNTLVERRTLTTRHRLTSDEVLMSVRQVLEWEKLPGGARSQELRWENAPRSFSHGSILSCVVPSLTDTWTRALGELCSTRPLVVGPGLKTGVRMHYKDPAEVGPDRIADVVAAKHAYGSPAIIVDLGTTTNIEVVDKNGAFAGGLIAPGLRLGAQTLSQAAARLPMIEIRAPRKVIGQTTRAAMQSGVVFGEVARIDGLLDAVMGELGYEASVILTGDDAATMAALLRHKATADDTLTLRGLQLLWEANQR